MDSVPIIVSTVLLCILIPAIGYLFVTTNHKEVLAAHILNDEENMREIRNSLTALGTKIDANFRDTMTLIRNGGNK